jgi:uncharacterized membrane protein
MSAARYRIGIAIASEISGLVALYLHLWKSGYMGTLSCGVGGGCAVVQFSSYGWFLGVDVALIGFLGYTAILAVSAIGVHPRWVGARWPTLALMTLIFPAVLFTIRLKYAEFVLMKTFCPWCAVSTVAISLCAVLVVLDARRLRRARSAPGDGTPPRTPAGELERF